MTTRAKIKGIVAKLEKQRRDLKTIIASLREISHLSPPGTPHLSLNDHEKRILAEALHRADGNQSEAARILKVSRDIVRYKIAKHGLKAAKR